MAKRETAKLLLRTSSELRKARPGILPPLRVDFEAALGALLKTPPPPKEAPKRPRAKQAKKRVAPRVSK